MQASTSEVYGDPKVHPQTEDYWGHVPVNLGSPGEFTLFELARVVLELTGSKSELVHKPLPQDDPMQRKPDISLAARELGWRPTVPVQEGLRRTIDYFSALPDTLRPAG